MNQIDFDTMMDAAHYYDPPPFYVQCSTCQRIVDSPSTKNLKHWREDQGELICGDCLGMGTETKGTFDDG